MEDHKREKKDNTVDAAIIGATEDTVDRFGAAVKEHFVAYSGKDNETGKELTRGLKRIAEYDATNPDYKEQNIKQQAGFAAEDKNVARRNAENIINRKKERYVRTDDVGRVNDPIADIILLDADGNEVTSAASQMKFVGKNGEEFISKFLGKNKAAKKMQSYLDIPDLDIEVPKEMKPDIEEAIKKKISSLKEQAERAAKAGKEDVVKDKHEQIEVLQKLKKRVKASTLTTDEAIEARLHPKLLTAKDVLKLSHRAGMESAGISVVVGGGISIVRNMVAVIKGKEEAEEAIVLVAKDTGCAAGIGYATGFTGAAIKGAMHNAQSGYVRAVAKSGVPGAIVSVTLTTAKTMKRYYEGKIDGVECLEELGEGGTELVASAVFAAVGQIVIPVPIVGGLIGSMFGYALASSSYGVLMEALREEKMAAKQRAIIEIACQEHIALLRQYRREIENTVQQYLESRAFLFAESMFGIKTALGIGDADGVISASNRISEELGREVQYRNYDEFGTMMANENKVFLL